MRLSEEFLESVSVLSQKQPETLYLFSLQSRKPVADVQEVRIIFSDFRKNIHLKYLCSVQEIERHEINLGHLDIYLILPVRKISFDNHVCFLAR